MHGFPNIFESERTFFKVMWSLLLLASAVGCIYFIQRITTDYLNYDVITKIELINENPMRFPAFTICNTIDSQNTIDKMLFSCDFNDKEICGANDFEEIQIFDDSSYKYLKCFRFNGGKNSMHQLMDIKHSTRIGYLHGFHLKLYLPTQNEFITYVINENNVRPTFGEFYQILDGGHTTDLIIDKSIETKFETPLNPCQDNETAIDYFNSLLFKEPQKYDFAYRQVNCLEVCIMRQVLDTCKCSYPGLKGEETKISCDFKRDCIKDQFNNSEYKKECAKWCPLECTTTLFKVDVQSIRFNPVEAKLNRDSKRIAKNYEIKNLTSDELKLRILSIFVFYDDLKYTKITQILKITVADMVSLIGGTLGLFLGLSLLSLLEIFEFILETLFIIFL